MGLTCQYLLNERYIRYSMYMEPMTMVASRKAAKIFKPELASGHGEGSQQRALSHQDSSIKCQPTAVKPEYTAAIDTKLINEQGNKG